MLRSQQAIKAKEIASSDGGGGSSADAEQIEEEQIDPLEFVEAVDILSKLPKDFYTKLEAKKWQERKESLECLENLLKSPKLENGDYGELIRALKKVLSKDSNVLLVAMAGKSLAAIASGLRKHFSPYASVRNKFVFYHIRGGFNFYFFRHVFQQYWKNSRRKK